MKYGFIGAGNIASALMAGACEKIGGENIFIYDTNVVQTKLAEEKFHARGCDNLEELAANAGIIILAVKPYLVKSVLESLKPMLEINHILVSVAASRTLAEISEILPDTPLVRVIPNLNAAVGAGVAGYCSKNASDEQVEVAMALFKASGLVTEIPESQFNLFTALASSAPAFCYLFAEGLAHAAHKLGMAKPQAREIAAQVMLGSAKTMLADAAHSWELIDRVCSPGGMTVEGVCALEDAGLTSAVVKAVEATVRKSEKL